MDVVAAVTKTTERSKFLVFTKPYLRYPIVIDITPPVRTYKIGRIWHLSYWVGDRRIRRSLGTTSSKVADPPLILGGPGERDLFILFSMVTLVRPRWNPWPLGEPVPVQERGQGRAGGAGFMERL